MGSLILENKTDTNHRVKLSLYLCSAVFMQEYEDGGSKHTLKFAIITLHKLLRMYSLSLIVSL